MLGIVLRHIPTVEARTRLMLNRDRYLESLLELHSYFALVVNVAWVSVNVCNYRGAYLANQDL